MSQSKTLQESFKDTFNASEVSQFSIPDNINSENVLACEDNIVLYCPNDAPWIGAIDFTTYENNVGWSMGYTELDDSHTCLYVFNQNSSKQRVGVQADLLDRVANLLGETPSDVANRVETHRGYPVVIPTDHGRILIAPVLSNEIEFSDN